MSDTREHGDDPSGWLGAAAMVALNETASDVVSEALDRVRRHAVEEGGGDAATVDVTFDVARLDELLHEVTRALAGVLVGDGAIDPPLRAELLDRAAGVVAVGAPARVVRYAIHTTCAVAVDWLVNLAEGRPLGASLTDVRRVFTAIAEFEFDLVAGFDETVSGVDRGPGHDQRVREAFLRRVIEGPVHDPAATRQRAEVLKLDLAPPLGAVLLVEPLGAAEDPAVEPFEERVLRCRRRPAERLAPAVFVEPDPASPQCAVLLSPAHEGSRAASVEEALVDACVDTGLLAVRTVVADLDALPVACHDMRETAPILERCSPHTGRVPTLDALFPYTMAAGLPDWRAEELLRTEVGPWMTDARGGERVATWKLLVRERISDAEAGRRLHVAPGTVRKRRALIERRLGRPLSADPFRALLASYVYELWEAELPPPGDPWWSEERPHGG